MVPWYWLLITLLLGAVVGLGFPRLCPRCKIERRWLASERKEEAHRVTEEQIEGRKKP